MGTGEAERDEYKRVGTILTIVQSALIVVLIILVVIMMIQINKLQGTARVVNYAGLVRGATQRLVKLEMTENPSDELVGYLDDILAGLKYEEGSYNLVSIPDENYQGKLDSLMLYWESLKTQIEIVRTNGYERVSMTELLKMSEVYFTLADETVSAAEIYSEKIAKQIRVIEVISAVDMCMMFGIIVQQTVSAMRIRRKNTILAQKAYNDMQTGLQNKNMCGELLNNEEIITEPTACLVFDINNLKHTNDTYGHLVGDQLIVDFAKALKSVVQENDFAGRYGGDEFMIVIYGVEGNMIQDTLAKLQNVVECQNGLGKNIPISYAYGWAVSTDYDNCTFRMLFNEADQCMYINKQKMKIRV